VVVGEAAVVACPRCRAGVEVPLVPAGTSPPPKPLTLEAPAPLTVEALGSLGVVLVDAAAFDELRSAYLVESAFAGMAEGSS
jgi:hypothetical protein